MKKRTIKITLLCVFTFFVAAFLVLNMPSNFGGSTRYEPVLSGSMEPAIPIGGLVLIKPVDINSLKVGDVICYHFSDEKLITHRIVEITSDGYVTKGDANEEKDPKLVEKGDIVGSVVLTVPLVGYIGSLIQTPIGLVLLLFIPGVIFILLEINGIFKEIRKGK